MPTMIVSNNRYFLVLVKPKPGEITSQQLILKLTPVSKLGLVNDQMSVPQNLLSN